MKPDPADAALSRPYLIAEAGTGHGGDLKRGLELVAAAVESGADCVKFQHVYADEIIHPRTGLVPLPGGDTPLYEVFRSLETGPEFLARLQERTEALGADFLCSPFGLRSLRELTALGMKRIKIASPELNHLRLLTEAAAAGLECILSTGVSRLGDIEEALTVLGEGRHMLMHCITSYPAPPEEYNLRLLPLFARLFGLPVGISDHSLDPELVPLCGMLLGCSAVEKHFTLDRSAGGLDDPVALDPAGFSRLSRALSGAAGASEEELRRSLYDEYGEKRIEQVLGDGRKRLAGSEAANYGRTNRSIHALSRIEAGEKLTEMNLAILRTEKLLTPGLHPRYMPHILGRRTRLEIEAGEGIRWDDILSG